MTALPAATLALVALTALASAALSAILVRAVRDWAIAKELHDHPNERSSHAVPKPRLGGVGVLAPVLLLGVALVVAGGASPSLLVTLGAVAAIAALGLADDLRPLPARVRFGVQVAMASVVVAVNWARVPAAAGGLGDWVPAPVLAVVAVLGITWLTNLYNFMDGIDGLAGGQALFAAAGLAVAAGALDARVTLLLLVAVAGASAGFLLFNFPPSSIFMGDVGSTALGFLLGCVPFLPEAQPVPLEAVALALSLFVLDATTTLARRVSRGERWYEPHRTHLYQRPVVRGVPHRTVTLAAWAGMAVVAACAARWPWAGARERWVLVIVPLALFAAGQVVVRRMEGD